MTPKSKYPEAPEGSRPAGAKVEQPALKQNVEDCAGEQYKCGHCGNGIYSLFEQKDKIITRCMKCGVQSSICISSELKINWEDFDERGVMCTGWKIS